MRKTKLTRNQKKAKRKYTQLIEGKAMGRRVFALWLNAGVQSFRLDLHNIDTLTEAEWYRDMLAIAIDNIIEENQP